MGNWIPLTEEEYDKVWDLFYKEFNFKPSISQFPSFTVPSPFITYDVSSYFRQSQNLNVYDDLENKAISAFTDCTAKDEIIYALDWQHECYWVNPRLEFNRSDEWTIPIFPNGDYYFFLQKDFWWGFLGHPWEKTITIFGKDLLNSFEINKPRMFQRILRKG